MGVDELRKLAIVASTFSKDYGDVRERVQSSLPLWSSIYTSLESIDKPSVDLWLHTESQLTASSDQPRPHYTHYAVRGLSRANFLESVVQLFVGSRSMTLATREGV